MTSQGNHIRSLQGSIQTELPQRSVAQESFIKKSVNISTSLGWEETSSIVERFSEQSGLMSSVNDAISKSKKEVLRTQSKLIETVHNSSRSRDSQIDLSINENLNMANIASSVEFSRLASLPTPFALPHDSIVPTHYRSDFSSGGGEYCSHGSKFAYQAPSQPANFDPRVHKPVARLPKVVLDRTDITQKFNSVQVVSKTEGISAMNFVETYKNKTETLPIVESGQSGSNPVLGSCEVCSQEERVFFNTGKDDTTESEEHEGFMTYNHLYTDRSDILQKTSEEVSKPSKLSRRYVSPSSSSGLIYLTGQEESQPPSAGRERGCLQRVTEDWVEGRPTAEEPVSSRSHTQSQHTDLCLEEPFSQEKEEEQEEGCQEGQDLVSDCDVEEEEVSHTSHQMTVDKETDDFESEEEPKTTQNNLEPNVSPQETIESSPINHEESENRSTISAPTPLKEDQTLATFPQAPESLEDLACCTFPLELSREVIIETASQKVLPTLVILSLLIVEEQACLSKDFQNSLNTESEDPSENHEGSLEDLENEFFAPWMGESPSQEKPSSKGCLMSLSPCLDPLLGEKSCQENEDDQERIFSPEEKEIEQADKLKKSCESSDQSDGFVEEHEADLEAPPATLPDCENTEEESRKEELENSEKSKDIRSSIQSSASCEPYIENSESLVVTPSKAGTWFTGIRNLFAMTTGSKNPQETPESLNPSSSEDDEEL